jgi:protein-disulfide isomerase
MRRTSRAIACAAVGLFTALSTPAFDQGGDSGQRILLVTTQGQKEILTDPGVDVVGAADADVTIVEYFDYNCPYCKRFAPALSALLLEDRKVAVVYKDWPILSELSVYAARSALAARWQGKYLSAHDALMTGARFARTEDVDAAIKAAGVNMPRLAKDRKVHAAEIDALLARNDTEARALRLAGTPGILIGRQLLPGIIDAQGLKKLVAMSRAAP